jgi:hypothetical protein
MVVDHPQINGVVARPVLDTSQSVGLGHFTTCGGSWVSLPNHGLQGETQLFQYDGAANQVTGARSNFVLPADPVFAISLYRTHPPADYDWSQVTPSTEIHFGVNGSEEWVLALPYGGAMYLMRRVGGAWAKVPGTEHSVRVPSLEAFASGQRLILWVAVWRGKLVVSTDGFAQDLWVYAPPEGAFRAASGPVSIWHNGGQFMFSYFPITMQRARLESAAVETGYETQLSAGEAWVTGRQTPVTADNGAVLAGVELADTTAARGDLGVTQRAWAAEIVPYVWEQFGVGTDPDTGARVDFRTCVSPQLFSVSCGQYAEVETLEAPELEDISADVKGVDGSHSDKLPTVRYTLNLDNQQGQHLDLAEYQRVTVELGWQEDDAAQYVATAEGYVVEPPPGVRGGGAAELEVALLDGLLRLRDEKADGRTPAFDGWLVTEVFHWVLDRCGVAREAQNLEETGLRLSCGEPERPLWLPEPGRSWLEFLQAVADFDYGATVFVDKAGRYTKACAHCRGLRTAADVTRHDGSAEGACDSEVRWELYTRAEVASDPQGPGEVLALAKPRLSLSEREFVNCVAVCGVAADGTPLQTMRWDAASLYDPQSDRFVGWRKMDVTALRGLTTPAELNRRAEDLLAARSGRPEYLSLLTPLEPGMRIGQVLAVHGGEQVGVAGQQYRIVALNHRVERQPEAVAVTWVKAKVVGG